MMTNYDLYKYRKINHETLGIFINGELYFSKAIEFNDPFDTHLNMYESLLAFVRENAKYELPEGTTIFQEICEQAAQELRNIGILSLSKNQKEILMWSHYADGHRGICLGFSLLGLRHDFSTRNHPAEYDVDYDQIKPLNRLLSQYKQSNHRPFEFFDADIYKILVEQKHMHWAYEKEVRFVYPRSGPIKFSPENLKTVIYGIRTPANHKKMINNILASIPHYQHVTQYQMRRLPGEFGIAPYELSKEDLVIDGDGKDCE